MSPEAMMQSWMTGLKSLDEFREKFVAGLAGRGRRSHSGGRRHKIMIARVLLAALALGPWLSAVAAADTASEALAKFGLIGTWAAECREPASPANPYIQFVAVPDGTVTRQTLLGEGEAPVANVIESAQAESGDRLLTRERNSSGVVLQIDVAKVAGGIRVMSSKRSDGREPIKNGILTGNGRPTAILTKCSGP